MAKLASTCTMWVLAVRVNFPGECSRLFVLSFLMTLLLGSERRLRMKVVDKYF